MTKQEKERAIIENIKALPSDGYGAYHIWASIAMAIGQAMGYIRTNQTAYQLHYEDLQKVDEIHRRMVEKGILKPSKSGTAWKLTN